MFVRVCFVLALVCLATMVAAETPSSASSKIHALRAMVETEVQGCPGNCKSRSTCAAGSSILTGKCPGAADIICCVPPSSPAHPSPTPAPAPAPTASKCAAVGGVCSASCATFATSGLCAGSSICCAPWSTDAYTKIGQLASSATGACPSHSFTSQSHGKPSVQGKAPKAFLKGVAYTYAKAVCQPTRGDVAFVGQAAVTGTDDILSHYKSVFASKGLSISTGGLPIVRHLYTLLMGLGMCESSGIPCSGRDMTSDFASADSAEAGLFQTSYGPHRMSKHMDDLLAKYIASPKGCFRSEFYGSMTCSANNWKNWPVGGDASAGFKWQKLTKECPAFAVEYASVLLRVHGGPKGEWNPLRKFYAELRPECDTMLQQVEAVVQQNPSVCAKLLA